MICEKALKQNQLGQQWVAQVRDESGLDEGGGSGRG